MGMAGAKTSGEQNTMATVFTHFLPQKFTPLSTSLGLKKEPFRFTELSR